MKRIIFMIFMVMILSSGCKEKGERVRELREKLGESGYILEYFGKWTGLVGVFYDVQNSNDPENPVRYVVEVSLERKQVDFYKEDPGELATETDGRGIKWGKYIVDRTNRTISIYRKRDGALIITVKFISDTQFRIVEYGKWFDPKSPDPDNEITSEMNEEKQERLREERRVKTRFIWGDFDDTNRVYRTD
ncbi:MAG: hypothetical protein HPY78_10640 [Brevinematales bacterium]|nr:hypothetical protein [Brevinematales bacterium]